MRLLCFILTILTINEFYGQKDFQFSWSSDSKLKWQNFRKIDLNDDQENKLIAAKTYSNFLYKTMDNGALTPPIAVFNELKSWTRVNDSLNLAHEQLHFDINELYARKIRKEFVALYAKKEYQTKKYQEIIDKYLKELNLIQSVFDTESYKYSKMRFEDNEWTRRDNFIMVLNKWQEKIENELLLYKNYALD